MTSNRTAKESRRAVLTMDGILKPNPKKDRMFRRKNRKALNPLG